MHLPLLTAAAIPALASLASRGYARWRRGVARAGVDDADGVIPGTLSLRLVDVQVMRLRIRVLLESMMRGRWHREVGGWLKLRLERAIVRGAGAGG